ncbi:MAG: malate dehydrogenase [Planctomycetota bacterium]
MKISIVGAGNVGATVAQLAVERELGDVVLIDVVEGLPQGKSLDLLEAGPVLGYRGSIIGANDLAELAGSDVVVVTAGLARKPGMSRDDLLLKNAEIIRGIGEGIRRHAAEAIVLMVTNPLDVMCMVMQKATGKRPKEVVGMAGVLDAARFAAFIALELEVSPDDIRAMVLGGHGDSMVPIPRYTTVGGLPITELLPGEVIERIIERTRGGGAEIVELLKQGSAFYAPGASAFKMLECIVRNKKRLLPASVWATGEYGIRDVYVGLPAVIGPMGVERIVEVSLTEEEAQALRRSAQHVRELSEKVK